MRRVTMGALVRRAKRGDYVKLEERRNDGSIGRINLFNLGAPYPDTWVDAVLGKRAGDPVTLPEEDRSRNCIITAIETV